MTAKNLDCESFFYSDKGTLEYDGYDVWAIPPSQVKAMAKELESVNFSGLTTAGLANEVSDKRGTTIPESLYESYFGDIEEIKKFIKTAGDQGHYLLFAEA